MQVARDRQKSYADLKRKPVDFHVRDKVMLKVSPWKGVVRFGKRGKLNPRYVGPFKVLEKVGSIVYKLELPEELSRVHNTFHVTNMKKCYADEPLAVLLDGLHFDDKLQFVEEPAEIMDRGVKQLRRSSVPIVKEVNKARDTVMSDSKDSTVTYTEVSSPFMDLSDIGSPGVVGPECEGKLPWMQMDPYVQEQPLSVAASPTTDSPGYVPKSDHEEDLEEDDDEDLEEDPADYPADGGDDGDDEDLMPMNMRMMICCFFRKIMRRDEEEEVHPAPADSTAVAFLAIDHAPSAEETKPFETDESAATPPPHPAYRITARMSIRDEPHTPFCSEVKIARLLAIPSPPPSPFYPWSSPLPQIPSPSLPVSPLPLPASPTYPLGYRAAMIRQRAEAPSTSHLLPLPSPIVLPRTRASVAMLRAAAPSTYILAPRSEAPPSETPPLLPIPLPTPSPPLLPPSTDRRADERLWFSYNPPLDDDIMQDLELSNNDQRTRSLCIRPAEDKQNRLTEALKLMKTLQTQLTALQGRQGHARGPTQPDAPEELGSSS
ncbi:hypothetical protein Tco_0821914 [Tanacetum coccineum]|uniref:Tf2-1-like SH3-like domain-containing protein n=1 Tax=Tanacetum coccineum TaxID=301880 RepID=A0ABQ5ADK4_9ASTR